MTNQLRLALGMRGGVSLAVWIGGASVEVDELCRVPTGFWNEVLAMSGYDSVVADVIAGASAGGLNGVLFAASQQYGFGLDRVRELWLEVGGIDSLVRAEDPSPSLLAGDGAFLDVVQRKLLEMIRSTDPAARPSERPRVDLQLSATLVEPIARSARSPLDERLTVRRSSAQFSFRHDPQLGRSDFPPVPDGSDAGAADEAARNELVAATLRLALAARATSSFPVAFEGAFVRSTRNDRFAVAPTAPGGDRFVDMRDVFSERQTADVATAAGPWSSDFVVADGGILDNIPLGKAIAAVQQSPADRPTTRFLVYLQPGTPTQDQGADAGAAGRVDPERRRSTMSVLQGAVKAFYESESIADDIAALEAHNERVAKARVIRHGTFASLSDRESLLAVAGRELESYGRQRTIDDAELIRRLLDDPLRALGRDVFPTRAGKDPDDRWRSPLAHWATGPREGLQGQLLSAFGSRLRANDAEPLTDDEAAKVLTLGVRPVARIGQLLLEWARFLEASHDDASAVKERLYRFVNFVDLAFEQPRRLGWIDRAVRAGAGDEGWTTATTARLNGLLKVDDATAKELAVALASEDDEDWQPRVQQFIARTYQALDALDDEPPPDNVDLRQYLAEHVLVPHAQLLRDVPPPDDGSSEGALLHCVLGAQDVDLRTLAALEIVCFPEFVAGSPGQRRIDFVRLSAGNRTPIAEWFTTLNELASAQGLAWSPPIAANGRRPFVPTHPAGSERAGEQLRQGIPLKLKLAGNELMNFAAFLRPGWRANDWMWGRLDSVPTLVDLLVTPSSMRSWMAQRSVDDALDDVRRLVIGGHEDSGVDATWQVWLEANVWTLYATQVARELTVIKADGEAPSVEAIRDALVARRQWEILNDELARPTEHGQDGPGRRLPAELLDVTSAYDVGSQTLTNPKQRDTVDAFRSLSESAARAITWQARAASDDAKALRGTPTVVKAATWAARAVAFAGPIAATIVLAPNAKRSFIRTRWAPVVAVLAVVALLVWAVLENWIAVVLTIAAFVLIAVAVLLVRRTSRSERRASPG